MTGGSFGGTLQPEVGMLHFPSGFGEHIVKTQREKGKSSPIMVAIEPSIFSADFSLSALIFPTGYMSFLVRVEMVSYLSMDFP